MTISYDKQPGELLPGVPTQVIATATDSKGNEVQCFFMATSPGPLVFDGFFPPLAPPGGSCPANALRVINKGSLIPVKFNTFCAGQLTFDLQPECRFYACSTGQLVLSGPFKDVANQWHFQIDTNPLAKGYYRIVAALDPLDPTTWKEIVVRIK